MEAGLLLLLDGCVVEGGESLVLGLVLGLVSGAVEGEEATEVEVFVLMSVCESRWKTTTPGTSTAGAGADALVVVLTVGVTVVDIGSRN